MKRPFMIQEHLKIASELCPVRDYLVSLYTAVLSRYPANSAIARQTRESVRSIRALISELDNLVFRDCPQIPDKAMDIYFGYFGGNQPFDEGRAKQLAGELSSQAEMSALVGGDPFKAVEEHLVEAFEKYDVATIKRAFELFSNEVFIYDCKRTE